MIKTKLLLAFIVTAFAAFALTGCFGSEPSEAEIKAAIKADITYHKDDFDHALAAQKTGKRLCNIWAYLEPVEYKVVEKNIGGSNAQYKLAIKAQWTKDLSDIQKDDNCEGDAYADMLGKPQKGALSDGAWFNSKPYPLNLAKFNDGWRYISS